MITICLLSLLSFLPMCICYLSHYHHHHHVHHHHHHHRYHVLHHHLHQHHHLHHNCHHHVHHYDHHHHHHHRHHHHHHRHHHHHHHHHDQRLYDFFLYSPSGCPVCESVSDAIGASIALEMTRISGLIDLRSANVRFH